ncbi:MAG: hypothetical protein ACR2RL_21645 [Gammaproteobacteria bacterium]
MTRKSTKKPRNRMPRGRTPAMCQAGAEAIEAAGGVGACHRALRALTDRRLDRTTLYRWRESGVTAEWVLALEHVSGVSRHRLRPDIYPLGESPRSVRGAPAKLDAASA